MYLDNDKDKVNATQVEYQFLKFQNKTKIHFKNNYWKKSE